MRKHLRLAAGGSAAGRWMLSILLALPALPAPGQVVLNELLASNRFTSFDEDGDSSDWVEIHNPSGLVTAHLERYGLSDRGSEPHKWVFPDVTIPPGGYLKVWLSGKDRYAPAPSAVAGDPMAYPFEASIIPPEAEWKYLVADPAQAGPPAGWNLPGFDASSFLTGNAGFGYGDEDDFTELAPGTNAVFIRRVFHIEPHRALDNLILQVDYDDGFVAYLNGQRVASANAPAGDPTSSSWAAGSHEAGTPARFDLTPRLGLLRPGDNVLALVGLNISAGSSDMSLHPALGVIPRILHASFSLNADGESLMITNALGDLVDAVVYPVQTEDHSYGRAAAEGGRWCYLLTPTPEAPNETAHFDEPISSSIEFDPPAGMYAGAITVSMSATPPGLMSIHYTLDGSEPTTASPRFWLSLPIDGNKVVRAAGFIGEERATRTVSQSYFIDNTSALPILSISMDPVEYALVHNTADGRGRAWERPAFLEYFDEDGRRAAATGMGLRLHGGAGRGGDFETKKAYRVYFRSVYGDARLHCPIIPETPVDRFDKLVLRSAFNDCFRTNGRATYLRDELIRDLHEDMGALASHGSWCMLYVNMKFRGLYNVVERMDEDFLQSYFEGDDWDVIKTGNDVLVGSRDEWDRLRSDMVLNDLSDDAVFEALTQRIDLENFTSYMIVNMWAQNHDWPHNNWYAARERVPEGKWIFLSWDAEFGIGLHPSGYSTDSFEFTLGRDGYIREIFQSLLANAGYRLYFMRQLDRHLKGALRPENVLARINSLAAIVRPDIEKELALFGQSLSTWLNNVEEMRSFARFRGPVFRRFFEGSMRYDFPVVATPVITLVEPSFVVNTGGVEVAVRGSDISASTQFLFNGIPAAGVRISLGFGLGVTLPFTGELDGPVTITAIQPGSGESADFDGLLDVALPVPRLDAIEPAEGSIQGGETVRITGEHFLDGVQVFFGDASAPDVVRVGGSTTELEVTTPPGRDVVDVRVANAVPRELASTTSLPFRYLGTPFIRGDANIDARVDLSDAIRILGHLFQGAAELPCLAAADANRSLALDLSDAIYLLGHLYLGSAPPPAPFPACGVDPVPGGYSCETGPDCP